MTQNLTRRPVRRRPSTPTPGLTRREGLAWLAAWVAAPLLATPARAAEAPLVGFVYVTPIGDAGWTWQHELGRRALVQALGPRIRTTVVERVAEGPDSERVMRDLVAQGATMVVATSFGYLEPALRVAADHREVAFLHAGGYKLASNLATYDARYYEARWLAGYAAGATTKSGVAGYVAAFPVPEVVQGLNAFTLGMRAARPGAEVRVLWLNTWFDPLLERDAARSLIEAGADVLTHHSASAAVAQAAEAAHERGVRVIPYPSDMRMHAPRAQLLAIAHRWGGYYTEQVQQRLAGRWRPSAVWGGIASGMVDLVATEGLPAPLARTLRAERQAIVEGRRAPFQGRLVDTAGVVRLESGTLDDARIRTMDWLVEGVVGVAPGRR